MLQGTGSDLCNPHTHTVTLHPLHFVTVLVNTWLPQQPGVLAPGVPAAQICARVTS